MPAFIDQVRARVQEARRSRPALDRVLLTQEHYGKVQAGQQAGAVTYFGFLSVFPILALAVFVVGWVSHVYPHAQADLKDAINQVMPGLVGQQKGQLSLAQVRQFSGWAAIFGVVGVLYAGLGWLSSLRAALIVVFELPEKARPNFVAGKLRDLSGLVILGIVLFVAVALTGFVAGFASDLLDWLGVSENLGWLVKLVTIALGLAANAVLFFAMFVLLAEPRTPRRSLWAGAVLGGIAFEILKQLSGLLLSSTRGQPAFQAFGIALILLVWINYFSRVILYAAAFAHVSPAARARRLEEYAAAPVQGPPSPPLGAIVGVASDRAESDRAGEGPSARTTTGPGALTGPAAGFLVGAGSMVGVLAVLKKMGKVRT